jgi:hypothetical protein
MMLLVKKLLEYSQRLSRYGSFSFEKRRFSTVNISKKKAHFDPRPSPMENMNLLLAMYT